MITGIYLAHFYAVTDLCFDMSSQADVAGCHFTYGKVRCGNETAPRYRDDHKYDMTTTIAESGITPTTKPGYAGDKSGVVW